MFFEILSLITALLPIMVKLTNAAIKFKKAKDFKKMLSKEILIIEIPLIPSIIKLSIRSGIHLPFTSELFSAYSELAKSFLLKSKAKNENKIQSISVIGLLVNKKAKQNFLSYIFLLFALTVHLLVCYFFQNEIDPIGIILIAIIFTSVYLNELIISYRIKNGLYGTNENEAREIINFILSNRNSNVPFDGYKVYEIFPELDTEDEIILIGNEAFNGGSR